MTTTTETASSPASSSVIAASVAETSTFGNRKARPLFEPQIVRRAIRDSLTKLDPRHQLRNPVMFVVEVGSLLTSGLFVLALMGTLPESPGFILAVSPGSGSP